MYWLENIDKYIEHYASPAIQQRGRTLFNIGSVRNIEYDTDNNTGTAEVAGGDIESVKIVSGVAQDFRNIETSCTCDFDKGICKHQVAALLSLKKKFEYNSSAILNIINFSKKIHNTAKEYELTDELLEKYELDAQYPTRVREDVEMNVKYHGIQENYLALDIGEIEHNWNKEKYAYEKVEIFVKPDKTTIRCSCAQNVIQLCNHQLKALYHLIIEMGVKHILKDFPDKDQLLDAAQQAYGIADVDDVEKFFTLTMGSSGPEYIPNDKQMVSFTDHMYLVKKVNNINDSSIYDSILSEGHNESNIQGIALFLDNSEEGIPVRLHVISGRGNKSNEKIVSNVQPVDDPSLIHPELRSLYLEYEKIKSLYNNNFPESSHPKLLSYFKKNLSSFRQIPLYRMKEKFSFRKADLSNQDMADGFAAIVVKPSKNKTQFLLETYIDFNGELVAMRDYHMELNKIFLIHRNEFYIIDDIRTSKTLNLLRERPVFKYASKAVNLFHEQLAALSTVAEVDFDNSDIAIDTQKINPVSKAVFLSEKEDLLIIQPIMTFDNEQEYRPLIDPERIIVQDQLIKIERDRESEVAFLNLLAEFDNDWRKQISTGFFTKNIDNLVHTPWILDFYGHCKEHEIEIRGYENLEKINYNPNEAKVNINLSSGIDWFEGEVNVTFGDQEADLLSLRKAILENDTTVVLKDGSQGLLPEEWINQLSAIFRNSQVDDGKLLISKMKFNLIDSLFEEISDEKLKLEIDYRKRRLLDFDSIEKIPVPDSVNADLRPYQKDGFNWMVFLDEFGFGGCLADDMGLGKTLQVITFLAWKKEQGEEQPTHLIVVPKSLLHNWADEIEKFCPSLNYHIYHGNKRKTTLKDFHKYDMIISTYGTITNDIENIMDFHFSYVVLDESQAIKNPQSKRYKAMRLIKSDNKLVLTGTPIENQTFDLYAQFNFINPGFFGSANQFKVNFAEPIDVYGNEAASTELRKLVKPFLLRRTKEQVAKDLPPKTESVIYCEMLPKQRTIYNAYLQKYKNYVSQKISENGVQRSKMFVIEALLKLRQICNSPALLSDESFKNHSVKIDVLMEQLSSIIHSHKVLVISQFTSMLSLIQGRVEKAQIPYSYLDGSTRNRKEVVDSFNEDDNLRVFLLSLKAGGVGLNLAAADYVYIVDPWWNPAAEDQAIDRAHRIGQENHVFAYRMICEDSIEEKIQLLQQKKKKMASDIVHVEESLIKSLDQEDIMALFS